MTDYLAMQPPSRDPFAIGPREHLNQILSIIAVTRNGDYRYLPLLMSKVTEVLPRLANPMLQNPPENTSLANIDIFDGFGNAGMAQPPPQMQMAMDTDYDRKFPIEEYDKQYGIEMNTGTPPESVAASHGSHGTPPGPQGTDMSGSFVNSPGVVSPTVEYSQNMNGFSCNPISDMVMSPMGNQSQSNTMNSQQRQHQHMGSQSLGRNYDGQGQQSMNGMPQGLRNPNMPSSHPINMYGIRQPPSRQGSFNLSGPPPMRTVGDFHGLQRAGSEASSSMAGISSLGNEMDFSSMR